MCCICISIFIAEACSSIVRSGTKIIVTASAAEQCVHVLLLLPIGAQRDCKVVSKLEWRKWKFLG